MYLYTSHEPGLPIALVQGIGVGCLPIVPDEGGGLEAIELAGIGMSYSSVDQAVSLIRVGMDTDGFDEKFREASARFSPELFRENVQKMIR